MLISYFLCPSVCVVLWRRLLAFCWLKNSKVVLLAMALQNFIYLEFNFQLKVTPKKERISHVRFTGSFEHLWTSFICLLSTCIIHQVVYLRKGWLLLLFKWNTCSCIRNAAELSVAWKSCAQSSNFTLFLPFYDIWEYRKPFYFVQWNGFLLSRE